MTSQRSDKVKIRGRYAVKHDNPLSFFHMMNRGYERDQTPYNSNKEIIDRLNTQWNSLSDDQKQPYFAILEEDKVHYQEVMKQESEKQKIMEMRVKNVRNLANYNRPALFYYLLLNTDEAMKRDVTLNSEEVTLELFSKWKEIEDKEKYEKMSQQYATKKNGEVVNSVNAVAERFFALIHLRYIWIQHMEWSIEECEKEVLKVWRLLLPNQRKPYEECARLDRERYEGNVKKLNDSSVKLRQKQEVWRPAFFYYLQDHYQESTEQSRAQTVLSLFERWSSLDDTSRQIYQQQSDAVTKITTAVRATFAYSCYCVLFKPYERLLHPDKKDSELLTIMKEQFTNLTMEEKVPYDAMMKEAKARLNQHKGETVSEKKQVKRTAKQFYCDMNMPELKRQHSDLSYSELSKRLQAEWKKLSIEEKEKWAKKESESGCDNGHEDPVKNAMKWIRSQKHPTSFIRQLTNFEMKAKKTITGKEPEDPWKGMSKEEKWVFYGIVENDIKRYKEDVSLAEEGKGELLQRKRKYHESLTCNQLINDYVVMSVKQLVNNNIKNVNQAWNEANPACRAISYLCMCYRIEQTEKRCKELILEDNVDMTKEVARMDSDCNAFCRYLIQNANTVGDWHKNQSLYTKWHEFSPSEKSTY